MKMARASQDDREMAIKLCSALEAIERDFWPKGAHCESEDPESFDRWNDAHCGRALRHLMDILSGGSIGRVVWGMEVLMDPRNELTDPGDDCLALHPKLEAALQDAKRLDFLDGNRRMKMGWYVGAAPAGNLLVSSVIQPDGQTSIRAAIDAAMPEAIEEPMAMPASTGDAR